MILRYFLAWFGMMAFAIVNGAVRDYAYKRQVGDLAARQVSTAILILLFAVYVRVFFLRWPLRSAGQAWVIGSMWFVMTEVFEFGIGLMTGRSWSELMHAYDLSAGQVWILIPLWVFAGPYVFFRFARSEHA